jgi:hypothetical protein
MTKAQLIRLLVGQARANGFEFRKWYTGKLGRPWESAEKALDDLQHERRYYILLFSHEFASHFWKAGESITFQVPKQTFQRRMADGSIGIVTRKPYIRRSAREDVWRYHLRELAVAEEPLRYMRRYLRVEEDLDPEEIDTHRKESIKTPSEKDQKVSKLEVELKHKAEAKPVPKAEVKLDLPAKPASPSRRKHPTPEPVTLSPSPHAQSRGRATHRRLS